MIENLEFIRGQVDIRHLVPPEVNLVKKGTCYMGHCPLHPDKTPSFSVSLDGKRYYCHGCHKSGDGIALQQEMSGQTFPEAAETMAKIYNIEIEHTKNPAADEPEYHRREKLYLANAHVLQNYQENAPENVDGEHVNLDGRKFSPETVQHFGVVVLRDNHFLGNHFSRLNLDAECLEELGLIKKSGRGGFYDFFNDRILFPICTAFGKIAGFAGANQFLLPQNWPNAPIDPKAAFSKNPACFLAFPKTKNLSKKTRPPFWWRAISMR